VLGRLTGVRSPTLEEAAEAQATYLRLLTAGAGRGVPVAIDADVVRHSAALLDTLAVLSREATA
jgi:hypothetical protein